MRVVLDTSALLAHHRDEEGADGVQSLFEDANIELLIASVTLTEFGRRMLELGASPEEIQRILADYKHLLNGVVSIDEDIAVKALSLAQQAAKRIPLVDSLIAAVACLKKATLYWHPQIKIARHLLPPHRDGVPTVRKCPIQLSCHFLGAFLEQLMHRIPQRRIGFASSFQTTR